MREYDHTFALAESVGVLEMIRAEIKRSGERQGREMNAYKYYRDSDGAVLKVGKFSHLTHCMNGNHQIAFAMFPCWRRPFRTRKFERAGFVSDMTLSVLPKVRLRGKP